MIITQINGGLGNQLFQYCSAKALSLHKNIPLRLDLSYFEATGKKDDLRFFQLPEKKATAAELYPYYNQSFFKKISQRLTNKYHRDIYKEPFFHYDPLFFSLNDHVMLKGLRQSEKYFMNYKKDIRNLLTIKEESIKNILHFKDELNNQESVSVHIRRGDYLTKVALHVLGLMDKDYYLRAFEALSKTIKSPKVYYFSDDIEWVEKELLPLIPGQLVAKRQPTNHIEDFYLMSQCKHNIIANSSFSWWAAWLNNNPCKIVIAPKKWFNKGPRDTYDLYPDGWLTI